MQYFLGSFTTIFVILIIIYLIKPLKNTGESISFKYSQSHIFEIVKPLLPSEIFLKKISKKTQSIIHEEKTNIKVIIVNNEAYWIKDNLFYVAEIYNNDIQKETARIVDTMHMDKVQLDKMLFIIDQLRDKG